MFSDVARGMCVTKFIGVGGQLTNDTVSVGSK